MVWSETDTEKFWIEVDDYTDSAGNRPFRLISTAVIRMLCLPTSNADIERVYSQVNVIKTNKRNRMKTDVLESILYIKYGLRRMNKKVHEFVPPVRMLKYNSQIYD